MFYRLKQFALLCGDALALTGGVFLGVTLRSWQWPPSAAAQILPPMLAPLLAVVLIFFIVGLYDITRAKNTWPFYQKIAVSAPIWLLLSISYFYIVPKLGFSPKTTLLLIAVSGFALVATWRFVYNKFLSKTILRVSVLFAGYTAETDELINLIASQPERGYSLSGLILGSGQTLPLNFAKINTGFTLREIIQKNNGHYPEIIVIAPEMVKNKELLDELYQTLFQQSSVIDLAKFYEDIFKRLPPFTFSESWFITNLQEQKRKIYDRFHILIDYSIAAVMGIFFVVTFPVVAALIKLTSPGPIFFKQERVGRMGATFKIFKYRTMRALSADGSAETDGAQYASVNDSRVTAVGRVLRRARLDEIPQFINIWRGEMAIIGPRPERPEFVAQLTKQVSFYNLRHLIKPGLTGWAQIQQSYYGDIQENLRKLEYDLYYLKNRGLILDAAILLRTISVIFKFMGR